MKNYGDLRGCYLPRPTASTDNTLLDLHKFFIRYSASFINNLVNITPGERKDSHIKETGSLVGKIDP